MKGVVDFTAEKERLNKELDKLNKDLEGYAQIAGSALSKERRPRSLKKKNAVRPKRRKTRAR